MGNKNYLDSELNQKIQNAFDDANVGMSNTQQKYNAIKEGTDMSEEDDLGLEFNLPDDLSGANEEKKEDKGQDSSEGESAEAEGLSFNLGDETSSEDLEIGADESGGLELGDDTPSGDLELGADESGDLELGDDIPSGDLELGAEDSGDLELGDDTPSGDLELGADESGDLELGDDTPMGDMELGADESGDLELGEVVEGDGLEEISETESQINETITQQAPQDIDDDYLNIPGAPTDDDMEITGEEPQMASSESTGDIDISDLGPEATVSSEVEIGPIEDIVSEQPTPSSSAPPPFPGKNLSSIDQNELLRLQGLIRTLKEERESFLKEIAELKTEVRILEQENVGLQASYDEARIEVEILKKRRQEEIEEAQYQLRNSEDKASVNDQKYRNLKKEFDRMNIRFNEEVSKVKRREKELENQLELVHMDSENQVNSRDEVIMNLKRKIDVLEFNMENAGIREKQFKDEKLELEEKLDKMMKTLRGSIKLLEEDLGLDQDILDEIKKI